MILCFVLSVIVFNQQVKMWWIGEDRGCQVIIYGKPDRGSSLNIYRNYWSSHEITIGDQFVEIKY
jgi:hypothetical protein